MARSDVEAHEEEHEHGRRRRKESGKSSTKDRRDRSDSDSDGGGARRHRHEKSQNRRGKDDDRHSDRHSRHRDKSERELVTSQPNGSRKDSKDPSSAVNGAGGNDGQSAVPPGKPAVAPTAAAAGRTGGVYIPPFKLAQMMKEASDKSSPEYQRMTWDALRKSINGLVNKVNASNIKNILPELFSENLVRGRGLFARSCMKSQMASPSFTPIFAALVAVVNTKFPDLGRLLLVRTILQFRRAFKRNDKPVLLATTRFIAHLVNQQVAGEVLALELLVLLLEQPTEDSVEVAVGFTKECGAMLQEVAPTGLHVIFERFRAILHEGEIDKRVQFSIEGLFAIRKAKFVGHPAVPPELDLIESEEQLTHQMSLQDEDLQAHMELDVFKVNPQFVEDEKEYEQMKKEILGEESADEGGSGEGEDEEEESEEESEEEEEAREQRLEIQDQTETNLINLRRTIYLTIMASVDFEEAGHKLMKIKLEAGQEMELCVMLLECCSQERTYLRYYGLLGERFCHINKVYQENFDKCFVKQYSMIHRLETNKLRNVAKFFAHLLGRSALPWDTLSYIRLTEEDTSSSARIFIKILFQELSEHLGLRTLNEKLSDPSLEAVFVGIFPRDNPKNTRFAINFFTSIGLGGLTDGLREFLKNMPRMIMQQQQAGGAQRAQQPAASDSDAESSDESESSGSESGSEDDSEEDSDDSDDSESESESDESDEESPSPRKRRRRE
eukprot:TRINITY_DN9221_c0_g1_i2.p1 TRINITY_DN9221_c0_g1~~TRINITY_DN9221_c0_g1_i2.p1  ORF type:complete len:726 (+),score=168.69 TRINITY_DN9221_c0_g1_i2:311-2488(+)